jgi:hypothetical protein
MMFTKRTYDASDIPPRWLETGSGPPERESGRGQPHSTTLARVPARNSIREVLECGCPLPLFSTLGARALNFALASSRGSCDYHDGFCFRLEARVV